MSDQTEAPQGLPEGEPVANPEIGSEAGTEQTQATSEAEGSEAPATPAETPAETSDNQPKPKPWFVTRLEKNRAEIEALRSALATNNRPQPAAQEGETNDAPALTTTDVERRAAEIAAANEFNRRSNEIYEAGAKKYSGDFDTSLKTFQLLGGLPPALIEAAQEAGDAHEILYRLGKNPEEAERILSMPPIRMAAAVAKLASSSPAPAPRPISSAPAPIKPITGQGTVDKDPEKMSMAEWVAWHDKRNTG